MDIFQINTDGDSAHHSEVRFKWIILGFNLGKYGNWMAMWIRFLMLLRCNMYFQ